MKQKTKDKIFEAWAYCDKKDKSTEFMLQYIADYAEIDYDVAVNFIRTVTTQERNKWYKQQKVKDT